MRKILILALKDLKLALRDRLAAFFYFVFPVLYAILIGYMMSGIAGLGVGMYRGTVSLAVVDQDQIDASAGFLEYLQGAKELKVHHTDFEKAKDMVRLRRCTAYLVLQKGFASMDWLMSPGRQPQMQLVTDEMRLAEGQIVRGMVYMQLMDYIRSKFLAGLASNPQQSKSLRKIFRGYLEWDTKLDPRLKEQLTGLLHSLESAEKTLSTSDDRPPSDPSMVSVSTRFKNYSLLREIFPVTFPQGVVWAMLFSAAFFASSLVSERSEGSLQRLRMAPLTRLQLLLGKGFACMMNGLGASLALLTVGVLFFEIRVDSYVLLAIGLLTAALCFSGMMMLLASLGRTPAAEEGIALSALLIMAMLGGAMVPEVVMPPFAKTISSYIPVKWAIMAMEGPIRRDFSFGEMLPFYLKLTVFGIACYVAGVCVFRRTENW
jgi:ABC-2 type transport system permease protein